MKKGKFGTEGRHFEEKEIGDLFHMIAVAHPVIPQDITVIPEVLNS